MSKTIYIKDISDTVTPQGIICIVRQREYNLKTILNKSKKQTFILLESLQDPGNLGTIMRTAEGAGVDAVIMNKQTVDLFNPKVIRSTMGSVFRVPFLIYDDLGEAVNELKKDGICVTEKLDTLTINSIAKNISQKLCQTFPNFGLNQNDLFIRLSRLDMYKAKMQERNVRGKLFL